MIKRMLSAAVVLAGVMNCMTHPAPAQAKPSFAGTWTMNMEKSDLGQMPKPKSQVETITQTSDGISIAIAALIAAEMGSRAIRSAQSLTVPKLRCRVGVSGRASPFKILEHQGGSGREMCC